MGTIIKDLGKFEHEFGDEWSKYKRYMETKVFSEDKAYSPLPVPYDDIYMEVLDYIREKVPVTLAANRDPGFSRTKMNVGPQIGVSLYRSGDNPMIELELVELVLRDIFENLTRDRVDNAALNQTSNAGLGIYPFLKEFNSYDPDPIIQHKTLIKILRTQYDKYLDVAVRYSYNISKTRYQFNKFIEKNGELIPKNRRTFDVVGGRVQEVINDMRIEGRSFILSKSKRRIVNAIDKHVTLFSALSVNKVLLSNQINRYEKVYVTRGLSDFDVFRGYYAIGLDFSQFDLGITSDVIYKFIELIAEYSNYSSLELKLIERGLLPDIISLTRDRKSGEELVYFDPYEKGKPAYLFSGTAFTTFLGHTVGTAIILKILRDSLNIDPRKALHDAEQFNIERLFFKNKGDDTLLLFRDEEDYKKVLDYIHQHPVLEIQPYNEFIGLKFVTDSKGRIDTVVYDIIRSIFNTINAESSISSRFRRCAHLGWQIKKDLHPEGKRAVDFVDKVFKDKYGETVTRMLQRACTRRCEIVRLH